ncbi:MAG: NHLP bacteriocin export ABC transporter permease/ATPase subunit [Ruthenibacterium sp.]
MMGWFDEQIRQRIRSDEDAFSESFEKMAQMITGGTSVGDNSDASALTQNAILDILKFYHVKPQKTSENIGVDEKLEVLLRPSGIMRRNVLLKDDWYQSGSGPMLGKTVQDEPIALIPHGFSGYEYLNHQSGKRVQVNKKNAAQISAEAICFYKPFPLKTLGRKDLLHFFAQNLSASDFIAIGAATLAIALVGLLTPQVSRILFSVVVESGSLRLLFAVISLLLGAMLSSVLLTIVKNMVLMRISTKLSIAVESASMMRLLSLPTSFFKEYSSGNIGQRLEGMKILCNLVVNMLLSAGFTGVFSLIYIGQIFAIAPALALPAFTIIFASFALSIVSIFLQTKLSLKHMEESVKESGMTLAMLSGIQKIKLAGAERRAFSKWTDQYLKAAVHLYAPPRFLKINTVLQMAITSVGMLVLYSTALKVQINVADYMAFNAAYGMVSAAFIAFSSVARSISNIKPLMQMVAPILKAVPEISENKKVVVHLSGSIEMNNVYFRYRENMPMILENISLKIRPGQYVAIAGRTGCGKSTLLRLLLGFETPQKGAIYYDGRDITTMDLKSLRKNMGVVIQNGKLFSGDIYSNITISAPNATQDDAWKAAEMAGMAEDIRKMPMGMYTRISEGSGGISGGQRQRLMIARAVASKPKILLFDEATSALDNITQRIVSESLAKMKCTRIVIAHRLSTIKDCDRIVMLDGGKIVEDGTYEELTAKHGPFYELVERQRA